MLLPIASGVAGVEWPVIPSAVGAQLLAVIGQLDASQWLPPEELAQRQNRQLAHLVEHAYRTTPFYRERLDAAGISPADVIKPDTWRQIPLLRRRDIQNAGPALHSTAIPPGHGQIGEVVTSGSTGKPVKALSTETTRFLWQAFTLRDQLWHRRDLTSELAAIRYFFGDQCRPPEGTLTNNWSTATRQLGLTSPCSMLNITSSVAEQAEWLARRDPTYVISYPSNLVAVARHMATTGQRLDRLQHVCTFGEVVEPHVRDVFREVWGVPVKDVYSSQEVGYLALQCPDYERYHVQAESAVVEVLNDDGGPCQPGQVGRVVVTTLHNFASPLIRYQIEDYAEVGEPCPCGRGLPTLERIVGRQRNMITLPTGERRWPSVQVPSAGEAIAQLPPVLQFQAVQRTLSEIEVFLVVAWALSPEEEQVLTDWLHGGLGHAFDVRFTYVDDIPAGPTGKYEDFRSDVT